LFVFMFMLLSLYDVCSPQGLGQWPRHRFSYQLLGA
jgi:hypothetical protein